MVRVIAGGERIAQVDAEIGHVLAGSRVDRPDEPVVEKHEPPV